ncbi:hypoxanthine phosphoribosyltransferase [Candidatus Vecturithrix granuli]|uniref:Hypoxanthine phosphoribosyltransferase n=1 Tax=Vecturithrix granuli TaxID=1499967 RepID=A0A081C584_VECG1|nr:hypoxanthine phosphoribosyltransferase [Candidatus Vecturithrix granuli]
MLENIIEEILISEEMIQKRVKELGKQISRDYADKDPILISILKGGVYFLIDLTRAITIPHTIDFMVVSSYGDSRETSGIVRLVKDLKEDIRHRYVLIIEDIIDSGLTLDYLLKSLQAREPQSIEICTLLSKPSRRKVDLHVKYLGYEIPDKFVVGYGLDYQQYYRNLPFICVFKSDVSVISKQ